MKTKIILPFFLAVIILSFSAYATMSCEITDAAACAGTKVLTLSELGDGGSHASTKDDPFYTKVVCCSGVAGLDSTKADNGAPYKEEMVSLAEGHGAKTKLEGYTQINLTSPTEITCAYMDIPDCLPSFETCLFSISGDSDAHVSTCDATQGYVYPSKYCCRTGEATCTITDFYWGIWDETTGELMNLEDSPCPVGLDMPVFLIAETSGCEGTTAEFTIYKDADTIKTFPEMDMGTIHGEPICWEDRETGEEICAPNTVMAMWEEAGKGDVGVSSTGIYKFKVKLTSTDPVFTTTSSYSPEMEVSSSCRAPNPITPCATTITETQITQCTADCSGDPSTCPDADCDTVADCIDDIITTPADCSTVGECSGTPAGTAGCITAMDCTNLVWSECKNCEAGQECDTVFDAGTMFMERCETGDCLCKWTTDDELAPDGCTDAALDQSSNRFKECIEEQEFPVFDGFNVVAVLLILSMYYAIVIIRKKK